MTAQHPLSSRARPIGHEFTADPDMRHVGLLLLELTDALDTLQKRCDALRDALRELRPHVAVGYSAHKRHSIMAWLDRALAAERADREGDGS